MPPDPERVQAIFLAAAEITDRAERAAHLDTECHHDVELRKRVEVLLKAHDDSEDLPVAGGQTGLVQPTTRVRTGALTVGQLFAGRYKLREMLGEGGMGEVWVADQAEPIQRRIALKVIKTGLDSSRLLARFEQERQALALMDHPNIAKVLDAGISDDGQPYFIMELVKGLSLTRYCDEARLSPRERLELFIPICQAVQHAHQKGIIHRDLKPSNILIGLYDGRPVPKVIDFGVAKATGPRLSEQSIYTEVGSFVGTLEYMSPEQAELNNLDIDTRADVYSLGVLLYELLTGTPPFTRKQLQSAAFTEMLRIIREVEPPKPSTKLSGSGELPSIAANRHLDPGKLTKLVMGELDWIVMKCLEKERGRRYETATGLGMDLQRYLADEAVLACPPSRRYRLQKFMRKNRGPVLAASLVALALLAGMLGTTFGLIRSNAAWREAVKAQLAASEQAEGERVAKAKAEKAEAETLADYRASTDDAIEQLIGSKLELGLKERTYLENTLKRWQAFASRQGDDERSRAIRAEGHFRVASLWAKLGHNEEARAEHQTALDILKQLVEQFPAVPEYRRDLARTHTNLGLMLKELARVNEARMEYLAAREIEKDLVAQYPTVVAYFVLLANTHNNLANLLVLIAESEKAQVEYEASRDIELKLVDRFPSEPIHQRQLAHARHNLGNLLGDLGKREEAQAEFQAARNLGEKLVARFPAVPDYQADLAMYHFSLGHSLAGFGNREQARREWEAALYLQQNLVGQFPAMPDFQRTLALTHYRLGTLLVGLGKNEQRLVEYQKALHLQNNLVERFPTVPAYQRDLANTHNVLGGLFKDLEKQSEARVEFQAAQEIQKRLAEKFPTLVGYQIDLGTSFLNFGRLLSEGGNSAESLEWFDSAIRILKPVHEKEPGDVATKRLLQRVYGCRAHAFDRLQKLEEAIKSWNLAVDLSPPAEQPSYRSSRASVRLRAGMVAEAVAEVTEMTRNPNATADQCFNFACFYAKASATVPDKKQEYADRAMELLQKSVKAGYDTVEYMKNDKDLVSLRGREDFKKLLSDLTIANKSDKKP